MIKTKRKRIIGISISVVLLVALVFAIGYSFTIGRIGDSSTSAESMIYSKFSVVDGYNYDSNNVARVNSDGSAYHLTKAEAAAEAGVSESELTWITTGVQLQTFLSGNTTEYGYLANDVTLSYSTSILCSKAIFKKVFDGNAYTVTINGVSGNASYLEDTYFQNMMGDSYSRSFAGMLVAALEAGTIRDCNFVYNSDMASNAMTAAGCGLISGSGNAWLPTAGIIAGGIFAKDGKAGKIENCYLDIQGGFSVGKPKGSDTSFKSNSGTVGGLVGAIAEGCSIERCTVNNQGGVGICVDGYTKWTSATDDNYFYAAAGGVVGLLPSETSAKILNCSVSGSGSVTAYCGTGSNVDSAVAVSGGFLGTVQKITGTGGVSNAVINEGQIDGILSSWTGIRTANFDYNKESTAGTLFGRVGSNVSRVAVLYDYIGNLYNQGYQKTSMDFDGNLNYGSWLEIYAKNSTGTVGVKYDYSKGFNDARFRLEASGNDFFADDNYTGSGSLDMTLDRSHSYKFFNMEDTVSKIGTFVWTVNRCETQRGSVSSAIVKPDEKSGALIYLLDSASLGSVEITFGQIVKASFENTNTGAITGSSSDIQRAYNGQPINIPQLVLENKSGQTIPTNNDAFDWNVNVKFSNDGTTWFNSVVTNKATTRVVNRAQINDEGTISIAQMDVYDTFDVSITSNPGKYTLYPSIEVKAATGSDSTAITGLAYFDANSHIMALPIDSTEYYAYEVASGDNDGSFTAVANGTGNWVQTANITISYMNKPDMFTKFNYVVNSQSEMFDMPSGAVSTLAIKDSQTTGPGGKVYTINAYIESPFDGVEYLKVGSTSITVKIDNEKPEINNVAYYNYDENNSENHYLGELLEDNAINVWRANKIVVVYEVTDNYCSGLYSGKGHTEAVKKDDVWTCYLEMSAPTASVTYSDRVGNLIEKTFEAKIDIDGLSIDTIKTLNYVQYLSYVGEYGYCPVPIKIGFVPVFGASGATLQYTFEKDANGDDIWVDYDEEIVSNEPNILTLDWNMVDATLKFRLVSNEGLYEDAYANGDGVITNGASGEDGKVWTIQIVIARIGITMQDVYTSLQEQFSSYNEQAKYNFFAKTYDKSTTSSKADTLSVKIYDGSALRSTVALAYSDLYYDTTPKISEENISIIGTFDSTESGERVLTLSAKGNGYYDGKYQIYFIDSIDINSLKVASATNPADKIFSFDKFDEVASELETVQVNTKINPLSVNIDLLSTIKTQYEFGEVIPTTFEYEVKMGDVVIDTVTFNYITDAKVIYEDGVIVKYPDAKSYVCDAEIAVSNINYNVTVQKTNIVVAKKKVNITNYLDGSSSYTTTIKFTGIKHVVTGKYTDAYGSSQFVDVAYYSAVDSNGNPLNLCVDSDGKPITSIMSANTYYAKFTMNDANYEIANISKYIKIKITKAFIELDLSVQKTQYDASGAEYKIVPLDEIDPSFKIQESFKLTYYPYSDKAFYDETSKSIMIYDTVSGTNIAASPNMSVGYSAIYEPRCYMVKIELQNNENFYMEEYDNTNIVIEKADTEIRTSENASPAVYQTFTYSEAGETFTYNLVNSDIIIKNKVSGVDFTDPSLKTIVDVQTGDSGKVVTYHYWTGEADSRQENIVEVGDKVLVEYLNTTTLLWEPISTEAGGFGWVRDAGEYKYRITFVGDSYYKQSSQLVKIVVKEADMKGIQFPDVITNFDELGHSVKGTGVDFEKYVGYGATVEYLYNDVTSSEPIEFTEVGEYQVTMLIKCKNFNNYSVIATLKINKIKMTGVSTQRVTAYYTGDYILPKITGLDSEGGALKVDAEGYHYYNGVKVSVDWGLESDFYKVGTHNGTIIIRSNTYDELRLEYVLVIQAIEVTDINFSELDKVNANTDLRNIKGTFTSVNGNTENCTYEFYDYTTGEKVELSDDGTLPAGMYTVKVAFQDGNYYSAKTATIEIVAAAANVSGNENNNGNSSLPDNIWLIVGIAGGAVVVMTGVVIAIVAIKKKKNNKASF